MKYKRQQIPLDASSLPGRIGTPPPRQHSSNLAFKCRAIFADGTLCERTHQEVVGHVAHRAENHVRYGELQWFGTGSAAVRARVEWV